MAYTIKRKDKLIQISVDVKVPNAGTYVYNFSHACHTEIEAAFSIDAIESQLENRVKQIRKEAYEAGWKDKTKRDRKKTEFNECINSNDIGLGW